MSPPVFNRRSTIIPEESLTLALFNAVAESFFHTLKTEHVYHQHYKNREEAKQSIFEYIEVFYNRQRLHSYCNYFSPIHFEEKFATGA